MEIKESYSVVCPGCCLRSLYKYHRFYVELLYGLTKNSYEVTSWSVSFPPSALDAFPVRSEHFPPGSVLYRT